ncbi:hypothetical protein DYH10_03305 [Candidatus Saccharibacteria bacterium CPR2]|nr:hypothetical protein [Candidatus Saccharibacteria bacterium CPR2]
MEQLKIKFEDKREPSNIRAKLVITALAGSLIFAIGKAEASREPKPAEHEDKIETITTPQENPNTAPDQQIEFASNEKLANFVKQHKSAAIRVQEEYGVPYQVTLAQAILESGYGESELAKRANNMFGMKTNSDWHGDTYEIITGEHTDNGPVKVMATFKKFTTVEDGFLEYGNYLKNRGFYDDAFDNISNPAKFLQCLVDENGPRYATDPEYANKVLDIMNQIQSFEGNPNLAF